MPEIIDKTPEPDEPEGNLAESLERLLRMLTRRRWWILVPAAVVAIGTVVVLYQIPNKYLSQATILVVQQQVPERYVTPTATTDIGKALEAMTQEVLSRPQLNGIIDDLQLYPKLKTRVSPEELIERMRDDISITPLQKDPGRREVNALALSFVADRPNVAQEVTSRLCALFIEQNLKTRSDQATTTTRFLNEQLESTRKQLMENEQKLREFKMQYLGELPEQQQGNLSILTGMQAQLDNVMNNMSRAQQQRLYLESLIGEYRRTGRRPPGTVAVEGPAYAAVENPADKAARELAAAENELRALSSFYTNQHPAVQLKEHEITAKRQLLDELRKNPPNDAKPAAKSAAAATPESSADRADDPILSQLRSQLEANKLEIENLAKAEQKLNAEVAKYHTRLNLTPVREQQLTSMLRDYELTKKSYADLLNKGFESQLATSLEKRQEGQQFRLIDPPSLPTIPTSPKRGKVSLIGLAAGLFLGLVLAVLAESRDSSFRDEKAVKSEFPLSLTFALPLILTRAELRRRNWVRVGEFVLGSVLIAAIGASQFYVVVHK